ncbi:MAG: hypothetical protein WCP18_00390 [bacterium]
MESSPITIRNENSRIGTIMRIKTGINVDLYAREPESVQEVQICSNGRHLTVCVGVFPKGYYEEIPSN